MEASVLLSVTMVGFETIFALLSCWGAVRTFVAEFMPLVTAFPAVVAMELLVPVEELLVGVPLVVVFVVELVAPLFRVVPLLFELLPVVPFVVLTPLLTVDPYEFV